ncbi:hypothetical protein [Methylococcus sp. EFPC2]|uniref:hypothetical protein n=1 Tax=Methylococcus sp. EFPC2 TaxID=2812648 RepID=UPI001967B4CC|nr:hypothetical protein [Methylococcus sp. EFPC2]QSA95783.1 hypothetical protein JWZ97_11050 [Methylococcus sp. EFPC2]
MNTHEHNLAKHTVERQLEEGMFAALVKYAGYILWLHYSGLLAEANAATAASAMSRETARY